MNKIILDTNFLLIPLQFNVDIFEEINRICVFKYKLFIIDKTIEELKDIIEKQRGKNKIAAGFALKLLKTKKVAIIETKENKSVDDLIVDISEKKNYIVATQDIDLKKRLKQHNVPLIVLRQKKYLLLEGKI